MPSALLALLLSVALLWAGIDWRWAWLVACPLGIALALRQWWAVVVAVDDQGPTASVPSLPPFKRIARRARVWLNSRPSPPGKSALFVLSFHLLALGCIGLQGELGFDGQPGWHSTVNALGAGVCVAAFILLLQLALACCTGWLRVLKTNQLWPAQPYLPRAMAWRALRGLLVCTVWVAIAFTAAICATARNSLELVEGLANHHIQVFSQPRYLQERLRLSYLFATVQGTPKPAWHELATPKSMVAALSQSKHPADRWTDAGEAPSSRAAANDKYLDEATQNFDHGITSFGTQDAKAAGRPELDSLIVRVDPGSPADRAGARRGDRLERFTRNAQGERGMVVTRAAAPQPATPSASTATQTFIIASADVYRKTTVSDIAFLRVADLSTVQAKVGHSAGAPRPPVDGVYLAVHGFEFELRDEIKRKLELAYAQEVHTSSQMFLMRDLSTVVVDLRSNGGGYTATVQGLVNTLLGRQLRKNSHYREKSVGSFWQLNQKPATENISWHSHTNPKIAPPPHWLQPKRLIVLTSAYTCSAAELFIHGIREQIAPSAQITVIGERTCGKPFGYTVHKYMGYQHGVISTATVNAEGQPAYPNGLQPNCAVKDRYRGAVLSDQDELWQAAKAFMRTGQCGAAPP